MIWFVAALQAGGLLFYGYVSGLGVCGWLLVLVLYGVCDVVACSLIVLGR